MENGVTIVDPEQTYIGSDVQIGRDTVIPVSYTHLVNCGAISHLQKSPWELTAAEFDNVIHTNLRGTFLCCQNFLRANEGADYGRIINIASTRWHQNEAGWEAYGASKGGVVSLTLSLIHI